MTNYKYILYGILGVSGALILWRVYKNRTPQIVGTDYSNKMSLKPRGTYISFYDQGVSYNGWILQQNFPSTGYYGIIDTSNKYHYLKMDDSSLKEAASQIPLPSYYDNPIASTREAWYQGI